MVMTDKKQELYYFYTEGCGFCKKSGPVVDELIKEGHNILKLDLAEPDNKGLKEELQKKYNKKCGTPWFINPETGHQVCGYREKDILMKWIEGEDIPAPPKPKSQPPKPPFHGASNKEEADWKKEYKKWTEENSHMPNLQSASQILERPRPKSEPPRPPMPNGTDEQIDNWGKEYDVWSKENKHLPNLQPTEMIVNRLKQQRQQQGKQPQVGGNVEKRLITLEQKLDKLMIHLGVQ
tara:strand:- start:904 stop:1611 length:708 start_codon:yes stop_codon:yes gene_type:complete